MNAPSRVEANARLTGLSGIVVPVLLLAELVTVVLGARGVLILHVAIGLILAPPLLVKLASTTWRMVNYYLRAPAYTRRGPPATVARVLGAFLSLAVVVLLGSGPAVLLGPSSTHRIALPLHKVSFYLALLLIVAHLATHLPQAVRLAASDRINHGAVAPMVRARWITILGSVLLGATLALMLAGHAEPYMHHYRR